MTTPEIAPQDYIEQTVAASRARTGLFTIIAAAVLAAGMMLSPTAEGAGVVAWTAGAWLVVQAAGALVLRVRSRRATVGLVLVVSVVTVFGLAAVSLAMTSVWQSVLVAGTWLAAQAAAEAVRGRAWRATIDEESESGAIVRGLAAYVGYDGAPLPGFLISGLLAGLTAAGLAAAVWLAPFFLVLHIGAGLGLAFAYSIPRSA